MSSTAMVDLDVMVPMRDGTLLAADVYRPAGEGRHPALLYRTPYSKSNLSTLALMIHPLDAIPHGYAVVVQDTRGRYRSQGGFRPFRDEAADGYDTVEWAASQPWCDGNVGIYGPSAMGVTTLQAAAASPPHLKAAIAYLAGADLHNSFVYSGGALHLGFCLHWSLSSLSADSIARLEASDEERARLSRAVADALADRWQTIRQLPLSELAALEGGVAPWWREWLAHPTYDDYWQAVDVTRRAAAVRVPVMHIAGWHDPFLRSHLDLHRALAEAGHGLAASHRFIVGPWDHVAYAGRITTTAGSRDFGPGAVSGRELVTGLLFAWFDHWLKGLPLSSVPERPVRYFMMGPNRWLECERWPPPHRQHVLFLHSQGAANSRLGDGALRPQPPASEPPDSFVYDPRDPVPSVGGRTLHPEWLPGGVQNQAEVELRQDILVYTSAHLPQPLALAGPVSVELYASSSAEDTDFTAKLVDVEPGGFCANVAEGILRARYREGSRAESWLQPGAVERFRIDLWDTAYTFAAGHRVRLEISSSNFPHFDRNLNTRVRPELGLLAESAIAVQQVWHTEQHPSCLRLSVPE